MGGGDGHHVDQRHHRQIGLIVPVVGLDNLSPHHGTRPTSIHKARTIWSTTIATLMATIR